VAEGLLSVVCQFPETPFCGQRAISLLWPQLDYFPTADNSARTVHGRVISGEAVPNGAVFLTIRRMKISARNQLRGRVEAIVLGVVTAKVGVRVGDNLIESVITRQSVEDLNIKVGSEVTAVIKSTEIMLMVD
jgi:molybdopterin-binding protein